MSLQMEHFNAIINGRKNIELRLNDEKRQQIRVGDQIVFQHDASEKQQIRAKVSALHHADTFEALFNSLSLYDCGFQVETDVNEAIKSMRRYYSEEQEMRYGVLGIELSQIFWPTKWLPDDHPVLSFISGGHWKRMYHYDWETRDFFTITTDTFVIRITGGSVRFFDKRNEQLIHTVKGFTYLYTGDVNADETELMALENGKHFYIFSLKDLSQIKRITLPKNYDSIDLCGNFSEDGKILYVPVKRFIEGEGFQYGVCHYDTAEYTLICIEPISREASMEKWHWR